MDWFLYDRTFIMKELKTDSRDIAILTSAKKLPER